MPRTNRNTLKEYFKRGSMPNQKHFYELIDSMVNISDDGIDKNPDDGLRLAPKSRKTKRDGCEKRNAFIETKTKCASNLIRKVTAYLQNQSKTPSLYIKINGIQMDF